jgi:flagellar hook assembly protein FlgD
VDVSVYNVIGQRIKTIYSNSRYGGIMTMTWDGTDEVGKLVSSGVYFLYVRAGDKKQIKKVVLIR